MEMIQTVDLMLSSSHTEQFIAEYWQLRIRRYKLTKVIDKLVNGVVDFEPKTPLNVLELQLEAMTEYQEVLEQRAKLEGINIYLENPFDDLIEIEK